MKTIVKINKLYLKTFMILTIIYFISFKFISLLMIPVENFYGSMQDYCDLLFLNFDQFSKWSVDKYDFTLYFIFMIILLIIFTLYNRKLNDIYNYDCMIKHRLF